jgi:ribose transport system permease protein
MEGLKNKGIKTNENSIVGLLKRFVNQREFSVTILFIILLVALALTAKNFLAFATLRAFMVAFSIDALVAIGMVILLIGGGFDLSVGSILALSGAVMNLFLHFNFNPFLSVFLGFLAGVVAGLINGLLVSRIGINALIATLATMGIYRSIALITFTSVGTKAIPEVLNKLADFKIIGLEFYVWLMFVIVILFSIGLNKSRFLRQVYYMGGNIDSARLSGINIKNLTLINFLITGGLASLAGVLYVIRFRASSVSLGSNTALDIITAVIIGGASLYGGKGSIKGALTGLGLMVLIQTGLVFWGVEANWQRLIVGAILILAVSIDVLTRRKRG